MVFSFFLDYRFHGSENYQVPLTRLRLRLRRPLPPGERQLASFG